MARAENQKLKILYVKDYLERYTDEEHAVTASGLAQYLESRGIPCERKGIYRDIEALQAYGMDIQKKGGSSGGYYLSSRDFELPELKLLVDAVQSSRFLTEKKSRALVRKLCSLCSADEEHLLHRQVAVAGRVKSMNESIYYNVDAIQEAIAADRQIAFSYFDWDLRHQKVFRPKSYEASPYALLWENDNYYLVAVTAEHGVTHFRVDRMQSIRSLDKKRLPCPELADQKISGYAKKVFQMYRGKALDVKMRFHRSLVNVIFDRFGSDCMLIPDGEDYVTFVQSVELSPMFFSWIMGFGDKAKILYPKEAADQCLELAKQIARQYDL